MLIAESLSGMAARAADLLLAHQWKVWFWGDSIGLEGLLDAAELTGEPKYAAYVHGLLKGWIAREEYRSEFDYTAPGVALIRVFEQTRDAALLEAARRHAAYLLGFRRIKGGAYLRYENAALELLPELPSDHPGACTKISSEVENGGPCVFVDCVHFDGPFFAKLYQVTQENIFLEHALENIYSQIGLLYDTDERLFHHFWIERTGRANGVLWARGNGWGFLGIALTLEALGPQAPRTAQLAGLLREGIVRLAELQDSSGAWHTILTDPDSYLETSTAAFFADIICRAMELKVVPVDEFASTVHKAMRYLLSQVRQDGTLENVSYETFPSTRPEHYRSMPRGAVVPWGQGPLLTAIRSYSRVFGWEDVAR
jgi:unsaturated rhamnogalacturonyl hydrolase